MEGMDNRFEEEVCTENVSNSEQRYLVIREVQTEHICNVL